VYLSEAAVYLARPLGKHQHLTVSEVKTVPRARMAMLWLGDSDEH